MPRAGQRREGGTRGAAAEGFSFSPLLLGVRVLLPFLFCCLFVCLFSPQRIRSGAGRCARGLPGEGACGRPGSRERPRGAQPPSAGSLPGLAVVFLSCFCFCFFFFLPFSLRLNTKLSLEGAGWGAWKRRRGES